MAQHPSEQSTVIPALYYDDPGAALVWLERVFGFENRLSVTDDKGAVVHAEMSYGNGRVMLGQGNWSEWAKSPKSMSGGNSGGVHVAVEDVDAHCASARAAGAEILMEPADQFYGDRAYRARDLEGHCWSFSQHIRDVSPEEMEAATQLKVEVR